jgi:hypothetical protein
MTIQSFEFDAHLAERCIAFRFDRYRSQPGWIPPFRAQLLRYYDPGFSFYSQPGNRHRHFVAAAGDRLLGHVTAIVNAELQRSEGSALGLLGLFECCEDEAVALDLIGTALDWLKREHAITRAWGPMNFDIWHEYRLKTRGFDRAAFFGEPCNPSAYPRYFRLAGFVPRETWASVEIEGEQSFREVMAPHGATEGDVTAAGYSFETVDPRSSRQVSDMHRIEVATLAGACGHTPLPLAGYASLLADYSRVVSTRFVTLLRAPTHEAVGLAIAYPDPSAAVRSMRGEHDLAARFRFAINSWPNERAIFYFLGILPEARRPQRGLGRALFHHVLGRLLAARYRKVVFALIASGSGARPIVGEPMRAAQSEYALFERAI